MSLDKPAPHNRDDQQHGRLQSNQEFQSAVIRLPVWVFMPSFIGIAGATGYYTIPIVPLTANAAEDAGGSWYG